MTQSIPSSPRPLYIRLGLLLTLGLLPLLTGCVVAVAGAAGAGAIAYVRGELETTLSQPYPKVVEATRAALKDLEFAKISENKDALEAVIVSRTALDKKVKIKISKVTDSAAKLRIRVDILGDESLSMSILEKIKANL